MQLVTSSMFVRMLVVVRCVREGNVCACVRACVRAYVRVYKDMSMFSKQPLCSTHNIYILCTERWCWELFVLYFQSGIFILAIP